MKLSIVSTMYCSAPYIEEFCTRIAAQAEAVAGGDYEIVLVNDGSPDHALEVALDAQKKNDRIRLVDLSRNFGHHPAIMAGLRQARGAYVFLIDIDLEEPPELLGEFWQALQSEADVDSVGGIQETRLGSTQERYAGDIAWRLMRRLSPTDMPINTLIARLMTRRFVDAVTSYEEKTVFLSALCADAGFKQRYIPVQKTDTGETTYTFRRKLNHVLNGVTATSTKPLLWSIAISFVLAVVTALVGLYALVMGLLGVSLPGWASTVLLVTAATTIITFLQGMNGLYIAHIFTEVKNRPVTIFRKIYERDEGPD
jgi:putative glycosyltransferase